MMIMPKHGAAWLLMLFSILSILCFTSPFRASAQETNLAVDPSSLSGLEIGDTFEINITISAVTDLYAWEFRLYYRNILNVTNVVEGPFLASHPDGVTIFGVVNNTISYNATHGLLRCYCTLRSVPTGVSGSGTLATITFKALADGDSSLSLTDTILVDSAVPFGNKIAHTLTSGVVHVGTHDVAITNTTTSKTITNDTIVYINVTVENQGKLAETFSVTAYYNSTPIEAKPVENLQVGSSITLAFIWDTITVPGGYYQIAAVTSPIAGEMDTSDNTRTDGIVFETIRGDVNGDSKVNILDISRVAMAFGSSEGEPKYEPNCDLDNNGIINIIDISQVAKEFGK